MTSTTEIINALKREFDPEKLTQEVVRLGEEWADKDSAASSLEEAKKSVLAKYTLEYVSMSIGSKPIPMSQAEMRALADPRYEQHLEIMVQARKEANITRVRYDMGKAKLELMRSLQSTLRAELQMR